MNPIQRFALALRGLALMALAAGAATLLLPAPAARAALPAYQCQGTGTFNVPMTLDLGDEGQAGATKGATFSTGSGASGTCNCPVQGSRYSWFTATTSYPVDASKWIKLNDYLAAQVDIHIYGPGNTRVPFSQVRNASTTACGPTSGSYSINTGSKGQITFKLLKGLLGSQRFTGTVATMYWQQVNTSAPDLAYPFVQVAFDVTLNSNASCQFRAGDSITVDLGDIRSDVLNVGAPPSDAGAIKTVDLSVDCTNVNQATAVNYMFQGNAVGPYVKSTLPGLGIGMNDANGVPIVPGAEHSVDVPLSGGATHFPVQIYPTVLPGQTLETGPFSAYYIVTLSLP